jgi:hypothetical protein
MGNKQRLRAERRRLDGQNLSVKFSVSDEDTEEGGVEVVLDGAGLDPDAQSADGTQIVEAAADAPPEVEAGTGDIDGDDPLEALRRQYEEVKAGKEAADRRAFDEAQRVREFEARLEASSKERDDANTKAEERAQQYETQLRERAAAGYVSQKTALEHAYAGEELKLANAKRAYADTLRNGDYDASAEVNAEIARITQVMTSYASSYHGIEAEERALAAGAEERAKVVPAREAPAEVRHDPVQPQQQGDQFETALASMHPKVAAWAREHKADVLDPARQKLAYAADALALAKGFAAGSDEYLDLLDEHMGYLEADPEPVQAPAPRQNGRRVNQPAKRPTAAPGSRASASSTAKKVWLTDSHRQQAKELGMSEPEFAKFVAEASENQLSPSQTNGRLMARYSA